LQRERGGASAEVEDATARLRREVDEFLATAAA
jgi:hypothetical protein